MFMFKSTEWTNCSKKRRFSKQTQPAINCLFSLKGKGNDSKLVKGNEFTNVFWWSFVNHHQSQRQGGKKFNEETRSGFHSQGRPMLSLQ